MPRKILDQQFMFLFFKNIIFIDYHLYVSHRSALPLCVVDEGVSDGHILRLGNSSNGNHRLPSCVKNAHKQVIETFLFSGGGKITFLSYFILCAAPHKMNYV